MNYIIPFFLGFSLHLGASEITQENYPLIIPVSVEKAPIQPDPIEEFSTPENQEQTTTDLDSDGDGVPNHLDKCPNTPKGFLVDGDGCPQTMTLQVHFKSQQADVDQGLLEDVKEFAQFLQDNKGYQVVIYGYTDNVGKADLNKKLSQKRAEAVKEALTRYGVKQSRLTAVGRGEENPIADNSTPEGRAANRRIEIELIQ